VGYGFVLLSGLLVLEFVPGCGFCYGLLMLSYVCLGKTRVFIVFGGFVVAGRSLRLLGVKKVAASWLVYFFMRGWWFWRVC
jgi:hypothetical protein